MTVAALAEPMPKLMIVIPSAVALGIGLSSQQTRRTVHLREHVHIIVEVDQQDVFTKFFQRHAGVTRQPVVDDFILGFHLLTGSGTR